jgi:DNA-binding MarR family transcriptional regulator
MTQLAHEMSMTTSGLTRLVDRMESVGLVERRPCPGDGRGLLAGLTPAGKRRLARVVPAHLDQIEHRFTRHLSADELETLTALLRRVRDGVRSES